MSIFKIKIIPTEKRYFNMKSQKSSELNLSSAQVSPSMVINIGDSFDIADLITSKMITYDDAVRAHVLLTKNRTIFSKELLSTFSFSNYFFGFSIYDTNNGPRITVSLINHKSKVHQILIPNVKYKGLCSVCGESIVPYDKNYSPNLFAPEGQAALCPCHLTQYCSKDCQREDWNKNGHKKVHLACMETFYDGNC